jgi:ABC-type multidrug transport system ATPase subunit
MAADTTILDMRSDILETVAPKESRQGQPPSFQGGKLLEWNNISMTVSSVINGKNKTKETKTVLDSVYGLAKPGETTVILGASGAGKTSLFRILAGRLQKRGPVDIRGNLSLNQQGVDLAQLRLVRLLFAYVAQQDTLHESSTPREALLFSAKLRTSPDVTNSMDENSKVQQILQQLGLSQVADQKIQSLSGGERRRTSIGIELVSNPSILFADEPTSGLDSFAAKQVLNLLQDVARQGNTVLLTLHQPSSDMFCKFDRILLLHQGRTMYHGLTRNVESDLGRLGYPAPEFYSTAEWLLDVAQCHSTDELESHGFFPSPEQSMDTASRSILDASVIRQQTLGHHVSWCVELELLFLREKNTLIRNPTALLANVGAIAFLSVVFGAFFYGIGRENRADLLVVQAILGALVNILISIMMSQSQSAATIFSKDRGLFLREYSTNHYSIWPYFLSKFTAEAFQSFTVMLTQSIISYFMIGFQMNFFIFFVLLFTTCMTSTAISVLLGSLFDNSQVAFALSPLVTVPQFYFSGVFIATNLLPTWIRYVFFIFHVCQKRKLEFVVVNFSPASYVYSLL